MAQSSSSSSHQHHHNVRPQIAILDFGSQYSHLIARRLRELHIYCELYSCLVSREELFFIMDDDPQNQKQEEKQIIGIILSGGPNSVYDPMAPHVHTSVWKEIEE
jgi:GMP synthase (glutamine-hydrolysing)